MPDSPMSQSRDSSITAREAARLLGVHENTIRNWQKRGLIGGVLTLPSGVKRYSRNEIQRMRREMLTQFAPATEMPPMRRGPSGHSQP